MTVTIWCYFCVLARINYQLPTNQLETVKLVHLDMFLTFQWVNRRLITGRLSWILGYLLVLCSKSHLHYFLTGLHVEDYAFMSYQHVTNSLYPVVAEQCYKNISFPLIQLSVSGHHILFFMKLWKFVLLICRLQLAGRSLLWDNSW